MTKNHMTRIEILKVGNLLTEHCHPVEGEPGLFAFEQDWDDERIARLLDRPTEITNRNVARLRTDLGMRIARPRKPVANDPEIEILQAELHELTDRYNKLILHLSLNHVADVRHLQMPVKS